MTILIAGLLEPNITQTFFDAIACCRVLANDFPMGLCVTVDLNVEPLYRAEPKVECWK